MEPKGIYSLQIEGTSRAHTPPRVGLLRERTGVPAILLYLNDIETSQRFEMHSVEDVENQIHQHHGQWNRRAWQCLLPFFEMEGGLAQVVTLPISQDPSERLNTMLGRDRGLNRRTGIYALSALTEYTDLIVVPQASDSLTPEQHQHFYRCLADWSSQREHYFILGDLPLKQLCDPIPPWLEKTGWPHFAMFHPWLTHNGTLFPPAVAAAAAVQLNDATAGINDVPSNRRLASKYLPLLGYSPAQLQNLIELRINVFHHFRSGGLRIWGGRTLASSRDYEYRFISTRRTMTAIREAVEEVCEPFVLEPMNDSLTNQVDVAMQTAFRPHFKIFDANAKQPFKTDIAIVRREREDILEVNVSFRIPYAVDEMSFSLGLTA